LLSAAARPRPACVLDGRVHSTITVADAPRNAPALPGHGAANRCDGDYVLNADGAGAADATVSLPLPSRARGPGALRACDPYADPTPEMVDAGVAVLSTSGAVEGQLHSDDLLVAEIFRQCCWQLPHELNKGGQFFPDVRAIPQKRREVNFFDTIKVAT